MQYTAPPISCGLTVCPVLNYSNLGPGPSTEEELIMNMTAHRVLALIKSTEDRLQTLLREAYFFDMRVGQATQIRPELQ